MGKIMIMTVLAGAMTVVSAYASAPVGDIITEPKGVEKNYNKNCAGTFLFANRVAMYKDEFPASVYWDNSTGEVYFKNIISTFPLECYVKGTLSGSTITVPCNQTIEYEEDAQESWGINFGVLKTIPYVEDGEDYVEFEYAPEIESVIFTVGADGSLQLELPGAPFDGEHPTEYVAGYYYTDDLQFLGYSDFMQQYTPLELQKVTIPPGADVKQYVYIDEHNYADIVDVAFDDGFLYIRGLSNQIPEGTIRARIDGDKAVVEQNEYVGVYYDMYYIFTKVLYDNPEYDEDDPDGEIPPYIFAPSDVGFVLTIDRENNTIYADKEGVYLSFHCDETDYTNTLGYFGVFTLRYQSSFAGTPANPADLEYYTDWAEYFGFNDFFFVISNFSTEGLLLDAEKLYYKVYLNGEPMVFYEHEAVDLAGLVTTVYPGIPMEVNLLPFEFVNDYDIVKYSPNLIDLGIYTDDVETIGVQAVYYYDNVYTYSDIVTLDVATGETTVESGVDAVAADGRVVSTEYYTLDGRRLNHPDKGIYIRVDRTADGTVKVKKEAR